jgi:hypothetical protein
MQLLIHYWADPRVVHATDTKVAHPGVFGTCQWATKQKRKLHHTRSCMQLALRIMHVRITIRWDAYVRVVIDN